MKWIVATTRNHPPEILEDTPVGGDTPLSPAAWKRPMIRHRYACDRGHWIGGPEPFTTCPVFVRGHPCTGTLRQAGRASGQPRGDRPEATPDR
jgi:hypothetical protein